MEIDAASHLETGAMRRREDAILRTVVRICGDVKTVTAALDPACLRTEFDEGRDCDAMPMGISSET